MLAVGRLGPWPLPRGPIALAGGLLTKLLLDVPWRAIDVQVLLLLAGLMALAGLAEEAGVFAGVRRRLAALRPWAALWTACLLVALASAVLLNDAAIVVLLPFLLPALLRQGLPGAPAAALLAVAANVGSLLTPMGNPQNAVLARAAGLGIVDFLVVQGPLVLVGFGLLAGASRWIARRPVTVAAEPLPHAVPRGRPWFLACLVVFVALAAWGRVPLGWVAAGVAAAAYVLLRPALGKDADRGLRRGLDVNVLTLFAGLYLLTGGLPRWFPATWTPTSTLDQPGISTLVVTSLSNLVGNVPAILLLLRLDPAWTVAHAPFLVAVSTLGGALLLTGSAASLLAADQARRVGVELGFVRFLAVAVPWVLPLLVLAAAWTWAL